MDRACFRCGGGLPWLSFFLVLLPILGFVIGFTLGAQTLQAIFDVGFSHHSHQLGGWLSGRAAFWSALLLVLFRRRRTALLWSGVRYRRSLPVATQHYTDIDAVLISHNHWDHLDLRSLRKLDRETRIIVPHGVAAMFRRRGYPNSEELREDEEAQVGPVRVQSTHAKHIGGRQ